MDNARLDLLEELLDDYGHDLSHNAVSRLDQMTPADLSLILELCRQTADASFTRGVIWSRQRPEDEVDAWLGAKTQSGAMS